MYYIYMYICNIFGSRCIFGQHRYTFWSKEVIIMLILCIVNKIMIHVSAMNKSTNSSLCGSWIGIPTMFLQWSPVSWDLLSFPFSHARERESVCHQNNNIILWCIYATITKRPLIGRGQIYVTLQNGLGLVEVTATSYYKTVCYWLRSCKEFVLRKIMYNNL